jgi:cell division protein FtsN
MTVVADVPFEIKPDVLGDIVYDLQLFVEKPSKETAIENETDKQGVEKVAEPQQLQVAAITDTAETVEEEFYSLQMGSFRNQTYAQQFADMLKYRFDLPVWVDHENRLYKVRMGKFADREAVDEFRKSIWEKGFDSFPVLKKRRSE